MLCCDGIRRKEIVGGTGKVVLDEEASAFGFCSESSTADCLVGGSSSLAASSPTSTSLANGGFVFKPCSSAGPLEVSEHEASEASAAIAAEAKAPRGSFITSFGVM